MKIEFKITSWAIALFFVAINALIYSWAFWSSFHINILQHASFSDAMPSILYTIALPCGLLTTAIAISHIWNLFRPRLSFWFTLTLMRVFAKSKRRYVKATRFKTAIKTLTPITILAVGMIDMYRKISKQDNEKLFDESFFKLYALTLLVIALIFLVLRYTKFLINIKPHRKAVVMFIISTPLICYATAHLQAKKILEGKGTYLIESNSQCLSNKNENFRYIASFSDKAFAMSLLDGNICIFKYEYLKLIPEGKKTYSLSLPSDRI